MPKIPREECHWRGGSVPEAGALPGRAQLCCSKGPGPEWGGEWGGVAVVWGEFEAAHGEPWPL